jgi:ketosteroid isomerase-like protein
MSTEVNEFLAATMPRFNEAEMTLHDGDAGPRIAMWSRKDPVTLFGAALSGNGWAEIGPIFERLGSSFSNCTSYQNEVVAAGASGDLAYIVAFEHTTASLNGKPPQPYVLRATTVFRREDGEWKVVHRHADEASATALAGRLAPTSTGESGPSLHA